MGYFRGIIKTLMEFESPSQTGTPHPQDIDDATRIAAMTKKTVLVPLHGDIAPEDPVDEQIANQHIISPALANIPIDTEATVVPSSSPQDTSVKDTYIAARADDKKKRLLVLSGIAVVAVALASGIALMVL